MGSFAIVSSAQIPFAFETAPTLIWAIVSVLLVAVLAIVAAALSARRRGAGRDAERGRVRALPPRRIRETQDPPLAA